MRVFVWLICCCCFQQCTSNVSSEKKAARISTNDQKTAESSFSEGRDYFEFVRVRVNDRTGFENPVEAYSFLAPKNWKVAGEVSWNAPGTACAGNNLSVEMSSPDGKYKFQWFPNDLWVYQPDPQLQAFVPNEKYCRGGQPMEAGEYFKQVFAANDLGNPQIVSISENPEGVRTLSESNDRYRQELLAYGAASVNFKQGAVYAHVKWADGREGLVTCAVNNIETVVPNIYTGGSSTSYSSTSSGRVMVTFPAGEKEIGASLLSVIVGSMRTNPAWKESVDNFWLRYRRQKHAENIGKIRMMDALTKQIGENAIRQGQQNLDRMDASMRSWEARQQADDRSHSNFVKAIREVEHYSDGTGKVELSSGFNHAWSRSDGSSFILSNNPNFDPSSVLQDNRWQEMKKVE